MQVRKVHPNRTLVELMPEEAADLARALERLNQGFSLTTPDIVSHLLAALRGNPAPLPGSRLDPAFSTSDGFTCKCPDVACDCDPEEGGVRRSPFPVPGPGTKADWDA